MKRAIEGLIGEYGPVGAALICVVAVIALFWVAALISVSISA